MVGASSGICVPTRSDCLLTSGLRVGRKRDILRVKAKSNVITVCTSELASGVAIDSVGFSTYRLTHGGFSTGNVRGVRVLFKGLFRPMGGEGFSMVLFGAPCLPARRKRILSSAVGCTFSNKLSNEGIVSVFLGRIKGRLGSNKVIRVVRSSLSNGRRALRGLSRLNFVSRVTRGRRFFFRSVALVGTCGVWGEEVGVLRRGRTLRSLP